MLGDRDYMRPAPRRFNWSATVVLLAINVGVFLLPNSVLSRSTYEDVLALSLEGLQHGYVWQLLTYQFLHAGPAHLFLNCWALFIFGRDLEWTLGTARFVTLYLVSGVAGGLLQALAAFLWPAYFGGSVVGASASVFGVLAAFAMLNPERRLTVLLFFIVPVNMRAKSLLWFVLVITALGIAFPNSRLAVLLGGNVAHTAHLGGILSGLAFARFYARRYAGGPADFPGQELR